MTRLIFLNRFFFPDHSATSQMLTDLAFHLAQQGRDVHVIASRQRYDDPNAMLPSKESIRGVIVHRVTATRFGRRRLWGRAVDYLSYLVSTHVQLLKLARASDVVIAKTDPPMLSVVAMYATRWRRAHLINWLQDLYPEIAVNLGVPQFRGLFAVCLQFLRDKSLKSAVINVAVGERMAAKLKALGVPEKHIAVVHNWSDDEEIKPVDPTINPLRHSWHLGHQFVVGYSGNLGRAHEFETIVGAAQLLAGNCPVVFVFIGGGHSFEELALKLQEQKVGAWFRFFPYQDRSQLKYSLAVPDVHLVSLRPELEGLVVPSKFYGIAAAGRPVLGIVSEHSEFAPLIREFNCGIVIRPGDSAALAGAIEALASDRVTCREMGARAREMLDERFTRSRALNSWQQILLPFMK